MRAITLSITCAAAIWLSGCTVHQTEAPGLTGPSEFALSVSMAASPDTLFSGGLQQSSILVEAKDPSGAPKANQTFRLGIAVSGVEVAFGTLSRQTVSTGSDGRATAIYTMPAFTPFDAGTPSRRVSVVATPIGTDYIGALPHSVELLVVPPAVPSVAGSPTASLVASTTSTKVGQLVTFDASTSAAAAGSSLVLYYWNFGDNALNDEHGSDASHVFTAAGTYTVVLGVQDDQGRIGSTFKTVVVSN
jgi:hypothetical protein